MNKYTNQYNYESEYLGMILRDSSLLAETNLNPAHFSDPNNSSLYKVILEMNEKGEQISQHSVLNHDSNTLYLIGGKKRIQAIMDSLITKQPERFEFLQTVIREFNVVEFASQLAQGFLENTKEVHKINELLDFTDQLNKLDVNTSEGILTWEQLVDETVTSHKNSPKKGLSGVNTGFLNLNSFTNGWQLGELIIIGARPSMGKTATILNMILNSVIRSDDTHATFFSCEMSLKSVMNRIFGQVGQIKLGRLRNPNAAFTQDDWDRHTHVEEILKSLKGRIEVTGEYKVNDIRARIRKVIRDNPNKKHCFYIDHIDHVKVEGNFSSKVQEVGEIAHKLKKIATEFNVPIILLSQLNRGVEQRENKRAGMSDLRDSGTIEQVADTILTLYREQYYNPDCDDRDKGILEMLFVKHRDGRLGTLKFKFSPELGTITEVLER